MTTAATRAPAARFFQAMAVVISVCWLVPVLIIAVSALSPRDAISAWPKALLPTHFSLDTLAFFFNIGGVWKATVNSVIVALMTMAFALLLGAPAGYALARFDFPGQDLYRLMILMTRAFPLAILALPLVTRFIRSACTTPCSAWRWCTPRWRCPSRCWSRPACSWASRANWRRRPGLGCSRISAFMRIVLPLALPGMAAAMIFAFVISWNEVFAASVLTLHNRTLTAFLFASLEESPLHFRFAGGFFLVLPSLIFIFVVRKYLFAMWGIASR